MIRVVYLFPKIAKLCSCKAWELDRLDRKAQKACLFVNLGRLFLDRSRTLLSFVPDAVRVSSEQVLQQAVQNVRFHDGHIL